MPDDRMFHKCLGHSQKVNSLTDFEDLVWRSYILAADDFGLMRFCATTLRADNDRVARKSAKIVQRALETVCATGLIQTFEHQGREYCYQRDWQDYQKIIYPKRTVNPQPAAEVMLDCTNHTRWLFHIFPGGKRMASWQCPDSFLKDSGKVSHSVQTQELLTRGLVKTPTITLTSDSDSSEPFDSFPPPLPPESLDRRAGEFLERYRALHVQLRRGASYVGKPTFDFEEALQLVGVYDDARLDKLAFVWLNTDHEFAQNGTRTVAKFRSMASWCEEKLIAWEDQHGPLKVETVAS